MPTVKVLIYLNYSLFQDAGRLGVDRLVDLLEDAGAFPASEERSDRNVIASSVVAISDRELNHLGE